MTDPDDDMALQLFTGKNQQIAALKVEIARLQGERDEARKANDGFNLRLVRLETELAMARADLTSQQETAAMIDTERVVMAKDRAESAERELAALKAQGACARCAQLQGALREIAKGEGAYDRDPLTHAANTIEDMKVLALEALKAPVAPTPEG